MPKVELSNVYIFLSSIFIDREAREMMSVRLCVCALTAKPFDLEPWHLVSVAVDTSIRGSAFPSAAKSMKSNESHNQSKMFVFNQ